MFLCKYVIISLTEKRRNYKLSIYYFRALGASVSGKFCHKKSQEAREKKITEAMLAL